MCLLCWDKPFWKIQSPPERKGMYLFDLKTVCKVLGKLPCQVIKWNNHVVFCHYDMLNVWWNLTRRGNAELSGCRDERGTIRNTTEVPISHADIILWHQHTAQKSKSPFMVWGLKMQDRTTGPRVRRRSCRSVPPCRLCRQPCSFLVYSCVSAAHPSQGVNVTEHALKCLLRLLLFSPIRLCEENRDERALQKMC